MIAYDVRATKYFKFAQNKINKYTELLMIQQTDEQINSL